MKKTVLSLAIIGSLLFVPVCANAMSTSAPASTEVSATQEGGVIVIITDDCIIIIIYN